jgi:hypothetical protein
VVVVADERGQRAEARCDLVEHVAVGGARHVLLEPGDAQPGAAPDRAGVGRQVAGDHLQQAGLAGPVAADEGDALARLDAQVGRVEEREVAEGEGDAVEREKRQG